MIAMLFRRLYPYIPSFIKKFLIMMKIRRSNAMPGYKRRVTIPFHGGESSHPPYERERDY